MSDLDELTNAAANAAPPRPVAKPESATTAIDVHLKAVMLIVAGLGGLFYGAQDLVTAWREKSPTVFHMASFARDYRGQKWLSLIGRPDVQRAVLHHTKDQYGEYDEVFVPLGGSDARERDPVHAIMWYGPMRPTAPGGFVATLPTATTTFTGQRISYVHPESNFRELITAEPLVLVQNGSEPPGASAGQFIVVLSGVFLLLGVRIEIVRFRKNKREREMHA